MQFDGAYKERNTVKDGGKDVRRRLREELPLFSGSRSVHRPRNTIRRLDPDTRIGPKVGTTLSRPTAGTIYRPFLIRHEIIAEYGAYSAEPMCFRACFACLIFKGFYAKGFCSYTEDGHSSVLFR